MSVIHIENKTEDQVLAAMIDAYNNNLCGQFHIALPDHNYACIRPFRYTPNYKDCEWFFVDGVEDPYVSDDSLEKLAKYFANYEKEMQTRNDYIRSLQEQEKQLAAIEDKDSQEYQEYFGIYSDCYKSLYGRRPKNYI